MPQAHSARAFACAALAAFLLGWAAATCAQTHVDRFGDFIVRSSVVTAGSLSPEAARQYGIERRANVGVLNVSVMRGDGEWGPTVRARVAVHSENLLGQREPIMMREISENERVSYLGTFEFDPKRVRRFEIAVQPVGSLEVHTQEFSERLFAKVQ